MAFDPITAILTIGSQVIDKIFPDKTVAEQQKTRLVEIAATGDLTKLQYEVQLLLGQIEINKIEAASTQGWVAGWRPFVGWICGSALAYHYILQPLMLFIVSLFHLSPTLPVLQMGELMTILLGILGLGAFRSYDKSKIVETTSAK